MNSDKECSSKPIQGDQKDVYKEEHDVFFGEENTAP